jgi:uncharacterized protein YbjT (DUF2867 family)
VPQAYKVLLRWQPIIDGKQVETVAADFTNAEAIKKALKGADRLLVNLPSTSFHAAEPIFQGATLIGKAAKEADIPLIVFNTSMPVPVASQDVEAQDDRRVMKKLLRDSGVPVIVLQPVCYLDNLLEGWALGPLRDRDTVKYCHKPTLRSSWICHQDVAALMLSAIERPQLAGRDFQIGGPQTVTLQELTDKLSVGWGRTLKCEHQTVADFCDEISKTMKGRGLETDRIIKQMFVITLRKIVSYEYSMLIGCQVQSLHVLQ